MLYLQLFWSFFQIGLFSIGGGYASLPLIQNQVVDVHRWLTLSEFTDLITISQMTPGPIAINSSTFIGIQVGGYLGALVATLGCILPSCFIVLSLAYIYTKYRDISIIKGVLEGLRPAVVALIASAGLMLLFMALWGNHDIVTNFADFDVIAFGLFIISLFLLRKFKLNPIHVMIGSGVVGVVIYLVV